MKSSSCVSLQKYSFENQGWTMLVQFSKQKLIQYCCPILDKIHSSYSTQRWKKRLASVIITWLAQALLPKVRPTVFDNFSPIFKTKVDPILLPKVGQISFSIFDPTMEKEIDQCYHYMFGPTIVPKVWPTLFDNVGPIFKIKIDPILLPKVWQNFACIEVLFL